MGVRATNAAIKAAGGGSTLTSRPQNFTPIATDMFLPNTSNMQDATRKGAVDTLPLTLTKNNLGQSTTEMLVLTNTTLSGVDEEQWSPSLNFHGTSFTGAASGNKDARIFLETDFDDNIAFLQFQMKRNDNSWFSVAHMDMIDNTSGSFNVNTQLSTVKFVATGLSTTSQTNLTYNSGHALTITTDNTDNVLSTGDKNLILNNTSAVGQTLMTSSINGTIKSGWRFDYAGNVNYHASGSQGHQFYNSLDNSSVAMGVSGSGIVVKGSAGETSSQTIYAYGNIEATGDFYSNGTQGYTGALNDTTSVQIADVVGGIITAVYY